MSWSSTEKCQRISCFWQGKIWNFGKIFCLFSSFFFTNSDNFSMSHLMDAVILEQLNAIILTKKTDKTFVWTYERHFDISCLWINDKNNWLTTHSLSSNCFWRIRCFKKKIAYSVSYYSLWFELNFNLISMKCQKIMISLIYVATVYDVYVKSVLFWFLSYVINSENINWNTIKTIPDFNLKMYCKRRCLPLTS